MFHRTKEKLNLIVDVQSSMVRGTLVYFVPSHGPRIIHTFIFGIPYKADYGSAYLIKMALRGADEIVRDAQAYVHANKDHIGPQNSISEIHFVLSSPWVVSQAKTLSTVFPEEMTITKSYVTGMIWEERTKMTSQSADDVRIIEEKVFDVRLNGYSVSSWESRHTRDLSVSFIVSLAGGRMMDRFIELSRPVVRKDNGYFHSSLFMQHMGIQQVIQDTTNYALVHAHGELTDLAIISQRACTFFGSYPYGVNTMIRAVANQLKTTNESAESTIEMVLRDDLDQTKAEKELRVVHEQRDEWVQGLRTILNSGATHAMPNRIIVSAHAYDELFHTALSEAFTQSTVETLSMDYIRAHVQYDEGAERLRLCGLYALAIHSL